MEKYTVYKEREDFRRINNEFFNTKGTRNKFVVVDKNNSLAFFKHYKYNCREICSEKICYELAKVIHFNCARIELAQDDNCRIGILNYRFVIPKIGQEHTDILEFLTNDKANRKEFYSLANIIKCLNNINVELLSGFIKIMIFDALVGETDRHEENWEITKYNGKVKLSPLYDNGCNLLWQCNENDLLKFEQSSNIFNDYIWKSPTCIFDNQKRKYKHFELIEELYKRYPKKVEESIKSLEKLTNYKIKNIVSKIPDTLLTDMHKKYIIQYLIIRRDILLNMIPQRG